MLVCEKHFIVGKELLDAVKDTCVMDWMNLSYKTEVSSRSDKLIFFPEEGDKTYNNNFRLLDKSLRRSLHAVEPSCMGRLSD